MAALEISHTLVSRMCGKGQSVYVVSFRLVRPCLKKAKKKERKEGQKEGEKDESGRGTHL